MKNTFAVPTLIVIAVLLGLLVRQDSLSAQTLSNRFSQGTVGTLPAPGGFTMPINFTGTASTQEILKSWTTNARFGPGIVDDTAPGAGPGPWVIAPVIVASSTPMLTVQNLGEKTCEIVDTTTGTVLYTVAGGQSGGFLVGNPVQSIAVRFIPGSGSGRVAWVFRRF